MRRSIKAPTIAVTLLLSAAAVHAQTAATYTNTNGSTSSGVVIMTSPDGSRSQAVNQTTPLPVSAGASTTGGAQTWSAVGGTGNALLTAAPVQAASGAHSWYQISCHNKGAADVYIQVFDALAAGVTLGTTVPKFAIWVPANGAPDNFGPSAPLGFANAITLAATTTETGATAPSAGVACTLVYE